MNDIGEVTKLLRSVLVVSLSDEVGMDEDNEILPSEIYLRYANSTIRGTTYEDLNITEEEYDINKEYDINPDDSSERWVQWTNAIFEET